MAPRVYLPEDIWGYIVEVADPEVLTIVKKVSKTLRCLVKNEVYERWDIWRLEAARPVHTGFPAELGDVLDSLLCKSICSGKASFVFRNMNKFKCMWLRAR